METEPRINQIEIFVDAFSLKWILDLDETKNSQRIQKLNESLKKILLSEMESADKDKAIYIVVTSDQQIIFGDNSLPQNKTLQKLKLVPLLNLNAKRIGMDPVKKPSDILIKFSLSPENEIKLKSILPQTQFEEDPVNDFIEQVIKKIRSEIWNRIK